MLGRMRAAWAVLRGQQLPDQMPLSTSLFPRSLGVYHINRRSKPSEQLAAYQAWVAAAVNVISMSIRQNRWFLCRQVGPDRDDIEKLDDDQVPGVLKMPDKLFDLGTFLELSVKHLDTAGGSFWYKVTANGEPDGEIIGLQIIYPNQILPHFTNPAGLFTDWEVTIPGHPMQLVPIEDIIWTYRPNVAIPYYGASPVEQIALSHDLDLFAKAYSVAQLEGGGLPPGILSLKTTKLTEEKSESVKARWRKQRQTPEDIGVLGDGAEWQTIGTSLQDLEWLALSRMTRDQVLAIYNTPAAKLGLVEDVNRANAIDVNRSFATDAIRPRLMMYEDSFNQFVLPGLKLPPDIKFRFENPVEDDAVFAAKTALEALNAGAITINEYRLETGREEADGGDIYSIKGSRTLKENLEPDPEPDPDEENTPPALPDQGQGDEGAERAALPCNFTQVLALGSPTALETAPVNHQIEAPVVEVHDLGLEGLNGDEVITTLQLRGFLPEVMPVSDRQLRASAASFENAQGQLETKFLKQLRQLISAEQRQVVKGIRERKTMPKIDSRALQAADFEGDDAEIAELGITLDQTLMFEDLVDFGPEDDWEGLQQRDILGSVWERQTKSWVNTYNRMRNAGMAAGWLLLEEEVGRSLLPVEPALEASENRILRTARMQVRRFRRTTRRQLARAVRKLLGIDPQATVDDVADEVSRTYDLIKGGRAATNARTDSSQAVNDGKARHMRAAERRLPVEFIAVWNAILDEVTRPAHGRAHGQEREVPQPFDVGGEQLRYPQDPRGSAGNVINCRCTTTVQMRSKSDD